MDEDLAHQHLCKQEGNSNSDQKEAGFLQIKEEQEELEHEPEKLQLPLLKEEQQEFEAFQIKKEEEELCTSQNEDNLILKWKTYTFEFSPVREEKYQVEPEPDGNQLDPLEAENQELKENDTGLRPDVELQPNKRRWENLFSDEMHDGFCPQGGCKINNMRIDTEQMRRLRKQEEDEDDDEEEDDQQQARQKISWSFNDDHDAVEDEEHDCDGRASMEEEAAAPRTATASSSLLSTCKDSSETSTCNSRRSSKISMEKMKNPRKRCSLCPRENDRKTSLCCFLCSKYICKSCGPPCCRSCKYLLLNITASTQQQRARLLGSWSLENENDAEEDVEGNEGSRGASTEEDAGMPRITTTTTSSLSSSIPTDSSETPTRNSKRSDSKSREEKRKNTRKRCSLCPRENDRKTSLRCLLCTKYVCKSCSSPYCRACKYLLLATTTTTTEEEDEEVESANIPTIPCFLLH